MVDEEEEELMTQYSNANDYFYDSTYKPDFNSNKRPKKKIFKQKVCECDFNRAGKLYFLYYPSHKSVRRLRFLINLKCAKKMR